MSVAAAPPPNIATSRAALKEVEATAAALDMFSTDYEGDYQLPSVGERRRRLRAGEADPVSTVSLILNEEGVLLWREGAQSVDLVGRSLRRGGVAPTVEGDLVELYQYEKLEPNEINRFLMNLDGKLNERIKGQDGKLNACLSRLELTPNTTNIVLQPAGSLSEKPKRRLLLVHGTFSKTEAYLNGFGNAPGGAAFLKRIFAHYDEVLAFDHPTLSVSPVLNAFDLFGLMARTSGPLDVVAHSRGGLVTRWFLEGFGAALGEDEYRGVLVGSPLGGTSLAAPARLRSALSVISNIGTVLKAGGSAAVVYLPLLAAPLALLKIATSVVSVAAKTPVVDAAVAMIPGLAGQSRIVDNHELDRLHAMALAKPPTYFVVQSNFETEKVGWKFWKWFRKDKWKDVGTDQIFPGDNDLVVDTECMTQFAAKPTLPVKQRLDFGSQDEVHHTNYFEQDKTLDFILDSLKVP